MKVKELIEELKKQDPELEIEISMSTGEGEQHDRYSFSIYFDEKYKTIVLCC